MLAPAGNPYDVVTGANIDTTAQGSFGIEGQANKSATWALTNNGTVIGGYFSVEFDSPVLLVNNGSLISRTTTAVALYSGGNVTNSAGAFIVGRFDGVFANSASSSVTNAGDIGGSASDITQTQSGIHLPNGGTVTNLATGKIAAYGPGVISNSAITIQNAGLISSLNGTAIDLTVGASGIGSAVSNSGTITRQGGTAILFGPDDNTLILAGTSVISGIVDASAHGVSTTNTLILGGASSGRFDISSLGASGQYRGFDILQKNDSGAWTLTGTNGAAQTWLVSGGGVEMAGRLSGSLIATPGAAGIDIEVVSGGAVIASSGNAVSVNESSHVVNSGLISSSAEGIAAVVANGAGTTVVNAGSIAATGGNAAGIAINASTGAASLTNEQGGSITSAGGVAVQAGSNVSIVNAGSIAAAGGSAAGMTIDASSGSTTLLNKPGGSIAGAAGVAVQTGSNVSIDNAGGISAQGPNGMGIVIAAAAGSASLTNEQGGSITSAGGTAVQAGSNVSIINAGSIAATGGNGAGVTIDAPTGLATLLNQEGGSIKSAAGAAVHAGPNVSITNAGAIAAEGANGTGVAIDASTGSASLTNEQGGSITSAGGAGVQAGSNISIINAGSIAATGGNGAGVTIDAPTGPATLLNQEGGSIKSAGGVAVHAGPNVSITNAGSIAAEGANGTGVAIDASTGSASLTNELGGSITSAGGAAVQAGSNVSIYNAGTSIGNDAAVRLIPFLIQ